MQRPGAILVRLFCFSALSWPRVTEELLTNRALLAPAVAIVQQLVLDRHSALRIQRDGSTVDVGEAPPSLIRV